MPEPRQDDEDIRYRNSSYSSEEDRNPRTIEDTRYRSTKYPGYVGGTPDQEGNLFFGGASALRSFRADQDERDRQAKTDAAKQAVLDEAARQEETPFGPADDEHRGIAGTVPNKWEQEDYSDEQQRGPAVIYSGFKQQGGSETLFDPSGEGSTLFQPKLASSPELQREGERQKAAIGEQWEDFKKNPLDYSQANPALSTVRVGESLFGRVICTELMRQKLMPVDLWRLDMEFTKNLSQTTVRGYHFWAIPYVRLMRKSKLATNFMKPLAQWRAEEIAYQMGKRERGNFKGKLFRLFIESVSWILGLFCKAQDYMVLYEEKNVCTE